MRPAPSAEHVEVAMRMLWILLFGLATVADLRAAEPFHAPAVPSGSVEVRLLPTEAVVAGTPVLVTFGVPFPRGSLSAAQLDRVRVMREGVEIPAYVGLLTPWRHRTDAAIDAASVRVARVQLRYTFTQLDATGETITVSWGGAARTRNVENLVDPRSAWHRVLSGSFVAADNVFEPDVYAVLPASWMVRGALKSSRSTPLDPSNTEARDSPASNDGIAQWPAFQEAERALKNNFYAVINRDDPAVTAANQCPYKTQREPWLYDRAATMYGLYFRSGFPLALREAVQAAQFYADRIDAQGFFALAPGDSKYAYNESLAYTYWLTGDDRMPALIDRVVQAHAGFPHVWSADRNFWTERHAAFKLLAQVIAYEVAGGEQRGAALDQLLADLRRHQDGADGAIPAARIDGGLYHSGGQHDGDWAQSRLGGSSWMSALLGDAAVRAYASAEDAATARFVTRLGRFMQASIVVTEAHSYDTFDGPLSLPRYAMLIDGSDGQRNPEDVEHSLDIAAQLAWAFYFSVRSASPDAALRSSAHALYRGYDVGVNHWIRPGGPGAGLAAYRVSPWRKWGWEHRISDGLAFALGSTAPAPPAASLSGLYFDRAQSGHGWVLHVVGDGASMRLAAAWYTYLDGAQRWLAGSGPIVGNQAQVALRIGRGADFPPRFDPASAVTESWGEATITIDDVDHAQVAWRTSYPGFASGAMALERLTLPASGNDSPLGRIAACHSGAWYDPAQNGHGLQVEIIDRDSQRWMTAVWYVYLDGQQRWLIGSGPVQGNSAQLQMQSTRGGRFPPAFDPAGVVREPWGSIRFTGDGGDRASLQWNSVQPGYASGSLQLTRLYALAGRNCT